MNTLDPAAAVYKHRYNPGYYAVALLDVMGIKTDLASIPAWPTSPQFAEQTRRLLASAAKRDFLRDRFQVFHHICSCPPDVPEGIDDAIAAKIRQHFADSVVHTQTFSDTVIAFTRLMLGAEPAPTGLFYMLRTVAWTMMQALAEGIPIRGGIAVGLDVGSDQLEVFGPAALCAHLLEEKTAQYPRIVIAQSVVNCLEHMASRPCELGSMAHAQRLITEKCRRCITRDEDGKLILDYLGKECRFGLVGPLGRFAEAFGFVVKQQQRWTAAKNNKLASYYSQLLHYWDKMAPEWMSEMRDKYQAASGAISTGTTSR